MGETRPHIVVAESFGAGALAKLETVGRVATLASSDEAILLAAVADCDALLVRTNARVTRGILENAPHLRVIGRGGNGLDNIDLDAARERNITVVYTPDASTDAVADLTIGMMIARLRRFRDADQAARGGRFAEFRRQESGRELHELTLGIVGMGRIGRAVARRARNGFGMTVLYNDIVAPGLLDFVATGVAKEELYARSDVVSLHTPLTDQTRHLINAKSLAAFKRGTLLINTARGAIIDGKALADALNNGHLGGVGLDVTDPEPLPPGHALFNTPNTLITPHIGARTSLSLARMESVVEDVVRVLQGVQPLHPVVACPNEST